MLRRAERDEIFVIAAISRAAFGKGSAYAEMDSAPPKFDSVKWHDEMRSIGDLYAIELGGAIAGGALLFRRFEDSSSMYVARIFIDPKLQGQGIGTSALREIETAFPNVKRLYLDVPEWDARVNAFCQRFGYTEVGRNEGAVYWSKEINQQPE